MVRQSMLFGAVIAAVVSCLAGPRLGAAQTDGASNPYNDELLRLSPNERAAKLASFLGLRCIGSKPFLMGITQTGRAKGYAYWSLECAGGNSYVIQIDPDGQGTATDCRVLAESGTGQECFKKF